MKQTALILILVIFSNILIPLLPQKSDAALLTNMFIRLDRQKVSTPTGGLVCTTTPASDNGTENFVQIIFPSGFTVNQNASNWTVTTSDIPSDAAPWPGISTANSVSGQIVTFPSSNLPASSRYCFKFSSSGTITTPSSAGSYSGLIRTRSAVDATIDYIEFGLSIVTNDSITVTGTVPAKPTDFQATLELVHPSNGEFPQNAELIYKLTYGSYLPHPSNITVEVDWDLGTISGNNTPTVNILNYIVGSATQGYGSTPAVIDVSNRSISWTHSPIPGDTNNQVVYFRLTTNSSYQGDETVSFSVNARVLGPGTQTADSTVTSSYLYNSDRFQPSSGTSTTSTSTPTPTPPVALPADSEPSYAISNIDINTVSQNQAQILVETLEEASVTINYGTSNTNLNQRVTSPNTTRHLVSLPNLEPNTRYFFRVVVRDASGRTTTSDLFSFSTASKESKATAVEDSLFLSSGDVILLDPTKKRVGIPEIVIPRNTRFSFKFIVEGFEEVKSVEGIVRNNNVLGLTTNQAYASTNSLLVTELYPGNYIGSITTSNAPGSYNLLLKITDYNGNIIEQDISTLLIVDYLNVRNVLDNSPVERAKATFYFYNQRTKIYEILSKAVTPFDNPAYSDINGFIPIVLPEGKYRVEIVTIGYETKTMEFELGPSSPQYPVVELKPAPFSIQTFFTYHFVNTLDAVNLLTDYVDSFKNSTRYLSLVSLGVITLFIFLAFFQISRIFAIPMLLLPFFLVYHLISLFHKPQHQHFIQGKVVDISTNVPIEGVLLHFATLNGNVFAHTRTNIEGDFTVTIKNPTGVKISISKKGYTTLSQKLSNSEIQDKLTITLSKSLRPEGFGLSTISWYFRSLGESFFESFLVLTIIVEIIFAQQFGIGKVILPLLISIGNLLLWSLHARPRKPVTRRA